MKIISLLLLLIAPYFAFSQSAPRIRNLVFEGSGIRGVAFCGAIQELEEQNLMSGVQRVGGSSAGAIMALLLSLGYSGTEISSLISSQDFSQFNDGKYSIAGGINRLTKYFGWYRGKQFVRWIDQVIAAKTGNAEINFEQLHQMKFRDLYVTGTCLNKQDMIVFSYETYPKMKIKDAVRISMSIPLYYEAVFIEENGNVVKRPKSKENLDVMIDGGLIGNFPIRLFDSAKYFLSSSSNKSNYNAETIGFRIDSDDQIRNDAGNRKLAAMPVNSFKEYIGALYNMVIENLNRQSLTEADWERTVSINHGGIGPRNRRLLKSELFTLTNNGRLAMESYLKKFN